ncbi:maleylacetoacetate isomerase [Heterostelium album PN500]|uniref:Maleylacetoacetate isomerase n=1 Tax=Heterostelium pallidum (strain ATCC 26659 / Pp 5 / PN500) TaxID=670386 RepID=D3BQZ2_HETP5|nr:maleylacetoacetate isomerase [Heterostelium album PN500]EFA76178.1 maleylacetoacetate isomerase [Heterostelium album PN500]|eukprot:XP_020428311.1 maleylacetoacetate isomerase [Heterostelium album PN500]
MSKNIVLYSYWRSSCSWRVRAALAFKKIDYEYRAIDLIKNVQSSNEYTKINPMKSVPTLVIDNQVLGQSLAILEYLEETRPHPPLLPSKPQDRATVRQMMQIIGSDIQPLQNRKVINKVAELTGNEENKQIWAAMWITNGFEGLERLLEKHSGTYCFGDSVTLADLLLPAQVNNANKFKVDLSPFPNILRINKTLNDLNEFKQTKPSAQPDVDNYWRSSCSWRVRVALALKKIDYEYRAVHLVKKDQTTEEYTKLNPMKIVPTLIIDGNVLGQSLAILEYLEETRPEPALLPSKPQDRAVVRQMMQIIGSDIQPLQNLKVINKVAELTGDDKNKQVWAATWIANGFNGLEKLLEKHSGKYCFGDTITFADLLLPAQVFNAHRFNVDLTPYPNVVRINNSLAEIPEFQAALPTSQPDVEC